MPTLFRASFTLHSPPMTSSSKYFPLFLLFTVLFALQSEAREPKFFNKASATFSENTVVENTKETQTKPEESDPNFLPESENGYGLYSKKSSSASAAAAVKPTTVTTQFDGESGEFFGRQLPKNYNPVAYVTGSESESRDEIKDSSFPQKQSYYMFDEPNEDNEEEEEPTVYRNSYNDNTYNSGGVGGGSRFSSRSQGQRAAALRGGRGGYFPEVFAVPQGMSDTRTLENGKYFYDINTEKYSSNHPFETLKASSAGNKYYYSNRRNYGNAFAGENSYGSFPAKQQNEFREEGNYDGNLP